MNITGVKLVNFCQHVEREDAFGPGIIGIVGRNGSGKSNYLQAIRRALTGTSSNVGTKEADLRWGATKGQVQVDFVHKGVSGFVRRHVKSASCLMRHGDKEYKTITEIDKAIYDMFDVSARMFSDVVFVGQGDIEGVLFDRPADRSRALQSLFGLDAAERVREFLGLEINATVVESREQPIKDLQKSMHELVEVPLASDAKFEAELSVPVLSETEIAAALHLSAQAAKQRTLAATMTSLTEQCAELRKRKDGAAAEAAQAQAAVQQTQQSLDETTQVTNQARAFVRHHDTTARDRARLKQLQTEMKAMDSAIAEVSSRPLPPEPAPLGPDTNQDKLLTLKAEHMRFNSYASALARGKPTCDSCGQPLDRSKAPEYEERVRTLAAQIMVVSGALNTHLLGTRARQEAISNRDMTIQSYTRNLERQQAAAAALQQALGPEPDPKALDQARAVVGIYDKTAAVLADMRQRASYQETKAADAATHLAQAEERLTQLRAELGAPVDAMAAAAAEAALRKNQERLAALEGVRARMRALREHQAKLQAQLAQYLADEAKLGNIKKYRRVLEDVKAVLQRNGLPALAARTYLRRLNDRMAKYLELFEAPFSSSLTPDMEVVCRFAGAHDVQAGRLSGGQKVMLGIAFRFAVYDMFVHKLGLLVLDEPTVWLDDDNVDCVFKLLQRVKSYSKQAGLQVIVVTHEQRLSGVFDQVIRL